VDENKINSQTPRLKQNSAWRSVSYVSFKELPTPRGKHKIQCVHKVIDGKELVVGDKIFLEPGMRIPADCILTHVDQMESNSIVVDSFLINGEDKNCQ
jgi:magnesium-transporting ATPase (P-type)